MPNKKPASKKQSGATEVYLEQYKAYLNDLGNIGSRYATANGFYLSVISALIGLLAFMEKEDLLAPTNSQLLYIVSAFGVFLCFIWFATIKFFGLLFKAKFIILSRLEKHLAYPCFDEEYLFLKRARAFWWTRIERYIPLAIAMFFAFVAWIKSNAT